MAERRELKLVFVLYGCVAHGFHASDEPVYMALSFC